MYMTTLATFVAFIAVLALIVPRPGVTPRNADSTVTCCAMSHATRRSHPTEQFPRLSRNRWARQDIARMLMIDDDYTGRITAPRMIRDDKV
jgi:hypothetical protein